MQAQENWTLILMVFAGAPVVLLQILIRSIFYGRQSNRRTSHFSFSFSLSLSHKHTHTHTLSLFLGKILSASSLINDHSLTAITLTCRKNSFFCHSLTAITRSFSLSHTNTLSLSRQDSQYMHSPSSPSLAHRDHFHMPAKFVFFFVFSCLKLFKK